ncbi:hypothetical protein R3W88_027659 [Solanum pinnatisectum]|uniref:Uncharacterized protein n=1 Tax=Solanum pinnatisectum TaxID=50273 RepID=A0AAV9LK70_9SOLN|nr:hypothetical protein R3W88_027659 [Solanum pinnatisectum]
MLSWAIEQTIRIHPHPSKHTRGKITKQAQIEKQRNYSIKYKMAEHKSTLILDYEITRWTRVRVAIFGLSRCWTAGSVAASSGTREKEEERCTGSFFCSLYVCCNGLLDFFGMVRKEVDWKLGQRPNPQQQQPGPGSISRKAEARNVSPCCCDKDPTICKSLCGFIDDYYCNGLYCICGSKQPPVQIAQTNETINRRI